MPKSYIDPMLKNSLCVPSVTLAKRTKDCVVGFINPFLSAPLFDGRNEPAYSDYGRRLLAFQRNLPFSTGAFYVVQEKRAANLLNIILNCNLKNTVVLVSKTCKLDMRAEQVKGGKLQLVYPADVADKEHAEEFYLMLEEYRKVKLVGIRNAVHSRTNAIQNIGHSLTKLARSAGFELEIEILGELALTLPFPNKS